MEGVEKGSVLERAGHRPVRVLIADDRRGTREALRALLGQFGELDVVGQVANGREALDCVGAIQPDVVLMDAIMPSFDGLAATRAIKAAHPDVRVVVLSLYPRFRGPALAAGADTFLLKGCTADELRAALLDDWTEVFS